MIKKLFIAAIVISFIFKGFELVERAFYATNNSLDEVLPEYLMGIFVCVFIGLLFQILRVVPFDD